MAMHSVKELLKQIDKLPLNEFRSLYSSVQRMHKRKRSEEKSAVVLRALRCCEQLQDCNWLGSVRVLSASSSFSGDPERCKGNYACSCRFSIGDQTFDLTAIGGDTFKHDALPCDGALRLNEELLCDFYDDDGWRTAERFILHPHLTNVAAATGLPHESIAKHFPTVVDCIVANVADDYADWLSEDLPKYARKRQREESGTDRQSKQAKHHSDTGGGPADASESEQESEQEEGAEQEESEHDKK